MQLAVEHHEAGRLAQAEDIYRQVLEQQPGFVDAMTFLAMVFRATGRLDGAVDLARKAASLTPANAAVRQTLAESLVSAGNLEGAIDEFRATLAIQPSNPIAWYNLSLALQQLRRTDEAIVAARNALRHQRDFPEAHIALADALLATGRIDDAIAHARDAVRLNATIPQGWMTLGNALMAVRRFDEAAAALQEAIQRQPDYAEAYNNLGIALMEAGQARQSIAAFENAIRLAPRDARKQMNFARALEWCRHYEAARAAAETSVTLDPSNADAWNQLGVVRFKLNEPALAIEAFHKAIALNPQLANAHNNLGNVLREQGRIAESIKARRAAIAIDPDHLDAWSNVLYTIHFDTTYDGAAILAEHRKWAALRADALAPSPATFANDRDANRPLRVGYVSPDLRHHVVGLFLLPLLVHRDPSQFHVTCYADVLTPDATSDQLRAHSDTWRLTRALSDDALTEQIEADQIDILVDLAQHSAGHRLLIFARKPAPVQVTYLGYPSTTGLSAIDYRLTDRFLDPPDQHRPFYSERNAYLESTYWCYAAPALAVDVNALPATTRGHVTFGCLNSSAKVSDDAMHAWARILLAVPRSRLILHANPGEFRDRALTLFAAQGIGVDRITFHARVTIANYFSLYNDIDIALDPFPYCGATTTLDALWMGVPVVSLVGDIAVQRAGLSILSRLGLSDLATTSTDAYISTAVKLAVDVERLSSLRRGLRERMRSSPLMNAPAFTRDVERLFRQMWQQWCGSLHR